MHWCKNWFSASTNCPTQAQSKPTVKVMVHPPHLLPHHCFPPPDSPTGFTPTPGSSPSLSPPFWIPRWRRNPRPPRSRSRTPPPHLPQRPTPSPDSGPWSGYHPGVRTPSFTSYPATPRASPPSSGGGSLPDPSPPRALDQRSPTEVDYILASTFQTTPTPPSPSSFTPLLSPAGNTTADAPTPSPL
jgi:hypothetical protein